MRATVCLLRAGQPTRASNATKSGQFIGQLSWATDDPIGFKGLNILVSEHIIFGGFLIVTCLMLFVLANLN